MNREEKIKLIKESKLFIKGDIIALIAIVILIILLMVIIFFLPRKTGDKAIIYSNNEIIKEMDLSKNDKYKYEYEGHYNIIEVKNGKISVTSSDCGDKVCISYGEINKDGDGIYCLPHKLKIVIKSKNGGGTDI